MLRKILSLFLLAMMFTSAFALDANLYNLNFSKDGTNFSPWNTAGGTSIISPTAASPEVISGGGPTWSVYGDGNLARLQPNNSVTFSSASAQTLFALSEASVSAITAIFTNITDMAYITVDLPFDEGQTLTMYWNYVATDYAPFNDASIASFVDINTASNVGKINGESKTAEILGATVLGTGKYSTGDYGSTGWQTITFQANQAGTYRLSFWIFNLSDTALSPILYVDDTLGTTLRNGSNFAPIESDPNAPEFGKIRVTFNPNNGSSTFAVNVDPNAALTAPSAPSKADAVFVEWRLGGSAFDFSTPITAPITLVAFFADITTATNPINTPAGFSVAVGGLAQSVNFTEAEILDGVTVRLDIEVKEAENVDPQEKTLLTNFVTQSFTQGVPQTFILDINMFKIVGGTQTALSVIDQPIQISFTLQEDLRGRVAQVVRVHNNQPESLSFTYNEDTFVLTFFTDRFSIYALVYGDDLVLGTPTPVFSPAPSAEESLPRTSGLLDLSLWFIVLGVGLVHVERRLR
jgi:hypothetical protein